MRRGQNRRQLLDHVIHPAPVNPNWITHWTGPANAVLHEGKPAATPQRLRRAMLYWWKERWQARPEPCGEMHSRPPEQINLQLYQGLSRARCSTLIQLRTGKTGLAGFLHRRGIPGYSSPACTCGHHCDTVKHNLIHCPRWKVQRRVLETGGWVNSKCLLSSPKGGALVSSWWLKLGLLHQFRLAKELKADEVENELQT